MKTKVVFLAFVVLLALTVSSAPVVANPAAIAYGAQMPIVERELKELQPTAVLTGDVSVISMRNENIGSRAAENLEVTLIHGLKLKFFATTLNLKNVRRVWFGFPRNISEEEWRQFAERTDTKRKYREARKNLGTWFEADPAGANNWQAYAPSDILEENAVTNVIIKAEGDFNHSRTRIFWLVTIAGNGKGTMEERLRIRCVEPPPGLEQMPRELIFAHLIGFHPAWSAPVMGSAPGMGGPMGPAPTVAPTRAQEVQPEPRGDLNITWEAPETPVGAPPPQPQVQGGMDASGPLATTELLAIRPDGDYHVLDRENNDRWVIFRSQRVFVYFYRPLGPGEAFEYGMTYLGRDGQIRWTSDAEGNPFRVPAGEVVEDHFFLRFNNRSTVAPGEHAIFVRVVGPNGELANITKTIIIKEEGPR